MGVADQADAPAQSPPPPSDARKFPPERTGDHVKPWRMLGSGLDALVRSSRLNEPAIAQVSRRLHQFWLGLSPSRIEILPTELRFDGKVALAADAETGRWILPAFMAGLRALTLRRDGAVDDLERLARELAALRADVAVISAFSDWLWSDGAQGFEVELHYSFVELADGMVLDKSVERPILASRSSAAVDSWNQLSWLASKELDAAALREEFQVPIQLLERSIAQASFELADVDAAALRDAADDATLWSSAELSAVLDHPELRSSVSPRRLATRLIALIETAEKIDSRSLDFLALLAGSEDEYAAQVLTALEDEPLGHAIGAKIDLGGAAPLALAVFLERAAASTRRGALQALLERAAGEGQALSMLVELMQRWGLDRLAADVETRHVHPAAAACLCRAAIARGIPIASVRQLLVRVPPRSAATALAALPKLMKAMPDLAARLLTITPAEASPLLARLLATGSNGTKIAAEALLASAGKGWSTKMLRATLASLCASERTAPTAAALARSREATLGARLMALEALAAHPELLAETVRWRPNELMEPPELRARLRELRKEQRERG